MIWPARLPAAPRVAPLRGGLEPGGDKRIIPDKDIDRFRNGDGGEEIVIPRDPFPRRLFPSGIEHKAEDQDLVHMDEINSVFLRFQWVTSQINMKELLLNGQPVLEFSEIPHHSFVTCEIL